MSIDKIANQAPSAAQSSERTTSVVLQPSKSAADAQQSEIVETPVAPRVEEIAKRLESYIRSVNRSLEFKVDAVSGRTVITVLDGETGDLIRQIPNEEVLRFAQMAEDQTIVLLNESV